MAGMAPEGSQFDAKHCDPKMQLLSTGETEFTSYEVYEVFYFDDKGLQENLLRGIYAYGFEKPSAIQHRGIVPSSESKGLDVMAGMAPEGSQLDAKDYDSQMRELLANSEEFTSYDEVCRSFDDMAIQENLLRGIYVYGNSMDTGAAAMALGKGKKKAEGKKGKEHTRRSCSPMTT